MKSYCEKNTFGIHFFIILMTKWSVIDEIRAKVPQNLIINR